MSLSLRVCRLQQTLDVAGSQDMCPVQGFGPNLLKLQILSHFTEKATNLQVFPRTKCTVDGFLPCWKW